MRLMKNFLFEKTLEYSENKIDSSKKINDLQQQYKDNEAQIAELTTMLQI